MPGGAEAGVGPGLANGMPEPDYSSLLPDYETACAQAMKQTPPPSYQVTVKIFTMSHYLVVTLPRLS